MGSNLSEKTIYSEGWGGNLDLPQSLQANAVLIP
jgi:hypothetical protein